MQVVVEASKPAARRLMYKVSSVEQWQEDVREGDKPTDGLEGSSDEV